MKTINHAKTRRVTPLPRRLGSLLALASVCGLGGFLPVVYAQADSPLGPPPPVKTSPAKESRADSNVPRRDRVFLNKANASGLKEIAMAQAASASTNAQVQTFARELVADHEKMGQELSMLAEKRGVVLDKRDERGERKLDGKAGKDLDEAFVKQVREEHEDAVKMFQEAADDSKDPEIREFAKMHLDVLRSHLAKASELKQAID